ncbi:MAG: hypothetical protein OQK09_15090 [Colwellia sp.]|nr:hypothetical protein [Colwellia sp.]MCW8865175.1 hypothetical protein [Colwellia sp.]MCW9082832.1 hypothetical protein [Colwellia sp.]
MNSHTPSKHVMALATYLSLLPMVYFLPKWLDSYLPGSEILRLMALLAIIVPITSYFVLPSVVKVLKLIK